jgi:hypothetical protein
VLDYIQVAIPILALVVNMMVQISLARTRAHGGYLQSLVVGFGTGFVCLLALTGLSYCYASVSWQECTAILIVNMGIYGALAFCYFAFVNLNKTSLRIRLFRELQRSPDGLSMEQIQALYDDRKIFELRMERLLHSQHVIRREGRYFLASYSLWLIGKIIDTGKGLVIGQTEALAKQTEAPESRPSGGN